MGKYDPLFEYLKTKTEAEVLMGFSDIENIIKAPLPKSARKKFAFWARAKPTDGHVWAHAWQKAGFRATVHFPSGSVSFVRHTVGPLDDLYPYSRETVMSLLNAARIGTEDWRNSQSGVLDKPQSNPNYCYNWSFGSSIEGYVLCVWHQHLEERDGMIVYVSDIPKLLRIVGEQLVAGGLSSPERERLLKHRRRALAFADVVMACAHGVPVRLIINAGDLRDVDESTAKSAHVDKRKLDSESWYVHSIDDDHYLLVRDIQRPDQVMADILYPAPPEDPGKDDEWREGQVRIRRGQRNFRMLLLDVYQRRCIVTDTQMQDLLEAAHITPHTERVDYTGSNGLLLRADVHTLYDLHHLSIDDKGVVHLSRELRKVSAYRQLHHKQLVIPSGGASPSKLESRHQSFLKVENVRPAL